MGDFIVTQTQPLASAAGSNSARLQSPAAQLSSTPVADGVRPLSELLTAAYSTAGSTQPGSIDAERRAEIARIRQREEEARIAQAASVTSSHKRRESGLAALLAAIAAVPIPPIPSANQARTPSAAMTPCAPATPAATDTHANASS